MRDRESQEKLDAYDKIIQYEKRVRNNGFRVVCSMYILELILCALTVIPFEISVKMLELTAILGLSFTVYIDNQIHKSTLRYKDEVINLNLESEDTYSEYFSKQKSMIESNCFIRKYYVWIHLFILVLTFSLNFANTLDFNIEIPQVEDREVVINNILIIPNDSTIIIQ